MTSGAAAHGATGGARSWGTRMMALFLASDAMGFAALLLAYALIRLRSADWPDPGAVLDVPLTAVNTGILVASSLTMRRAERACAEGDARGLGRFLIVTLAAGAVFLGIQTYEWTHLLAQGLAARSANFYAAFYATTGFHGLHVLAGVLYLGYIFAGVRAGRFGPERPMAVEAAAMYWHFVDVVWLVVFAAVYLW